MALSTADRPLVEVISVFAKAGLEIGLLVPTANGLEKGIMDAHASLREVLKRSGLHDISKQAQGAREHAVKLKTKVLTSSGIAETTTSLYRPETKSGDPRIWIYGLPSWARPGNVLALVPHQRELYVVNGSDHKLVDENGLPSAALADLIARLAPSMGEAASELLDRLRRVAERGFVRTMRAGPTGVGYTLESLLGIAANSRRTPDFKGIEIKASRTKQSGSAITRTTLFSKTPDWRASPYSALRLVQKYGRLNEEGRKQIYCTLANRPNPTFGFYLAVDEELDCLMSLRGTPGSPSTLDDERLFQWSLPVLHDALKKKHRETFWVKARVRNQGHDECFNYFEVVHTQSPLASNFGPLVESGHIELDFLIHLKETSGGEQRTRDHGYLFKMWEKHRHLLFSEPRIYNLLT